MLKPPLLAALASGLLACATAPAPTPTPPPAPTPTPAPNPAAAQGKLLCAKIALVTSSSGRAPTKSVPLDQLAAEGASMDVFIDADMTRLHAELLGESTRQQVDYRFQAGRLVCSHEMSTSLHTVLGGKEDGSGPPPFWRVDFRVFDATGAVVHATFDEAPGVDEQHRSPAETAAFAKELLALTN